MCWLQKADEILKDIQTSAITIHCVKDQNSVNVNVYVIFYGQLHF